MFTDTRRVHHLISSGQISRDPTALGLMHQTRFGGQSPSGSAPADAGSVESRKITVEKVPSEVHPSDLGTEHFMSMWLVN